MDKATLRKKYLELRKQLTPEEINSASQKVVDHFSSLDFSGIKYLHVFYPIPGKHEFNSLLLVDWIKLMHPEIKLVLPKSNIANNTLQHIIWTWNTPLAMNEWGITEPEYGKPVQPETLDMILIPLLAFDKKGNRIGYGKGFYDRFLSECRADAIKVGVSFFEAEEIFTEVDPYDVPLDLCITPEKIWDFAGQRNYTSNSNNTGQ